MKKAIIITGAVVAAIAAGSASYIYHKNSSPEKPAASSKETAVFKEFDNEYIHIKAGSNHEIRETDKKSDSLLMGVTVQYDEDIDKKRASEVFVNIGITDSGDSEAMEKGAETAYNSRAKDPDTYFSVTRDKKEIFGYEAEHVYYEASIPPDTPRFGRDQYSFIKDGHTYYINVVFQKDRDEAEVQEMLDGITIK